MVAAAWSWMTVAALKHHSGGMPSVVLQGVNRPFVNTVVLPPRRVAFSAAMRVSSAATIDSCETKPSRKSSVSV